MTEPADSTPPRWVTARIDGGFHTRISARAHGINADEPRSLNGTDRGMTPYELLLASLSSCMAMTMRMYADHKGWPLEGATVRLRTAPTPDPDKAVLVSGPESVTRIERHVELTGPLTEEQRARIIEIGDRCPVKRNLEAGIQVVSAT